MSIEVRRRPFEHSFSGNPIHYQLFSDAAAADASIYFEVRVLLKYITDADYSEVIILPHYPTAGKADVNIQDILDSKLDFKVPEFNDDETVYSTAERQTAKYYLQFREVTDDSPDPAWDDSELEFERTVLKGGLNYFTYRGNNYWLNYYNDQKPFLTWQQSGRLTSLRERMYLAWLNSVSVADSLPVRVDIFYTDGTTDFITFNLGGHKDSIIYIPAGATQLGLPDLSDKTIYYWEIKVTSIIDGGAAIDVSESFRYYADNRNDDNDITLNYRNSLGGLDSVRVRGVIEHGLNYDFAEQDRTVDPDYFDGDAITAKRVIANSKERKIYKGDIGYLTKEDQDRFRDSHLIREVWWERSIKWWPVVILTPSQKQMRTDDDLFSFPLQFALASDGDNYYTPDAVDLGDGSFTSNVCRARFLDVEVTIDLSGADALITLTWSTTDPDNVATQYTYQVIGVNDDPIIADLTTGSLVFHLPKDDVFEMEIRVLCPNNVPGKKTVLTIDTNAPEGGGDSLNSAVFNFSSTASDYDIKVNGVSVKTGHMNPYESGFTGYNGFHVDDVSDVTVTIELGFNPATPVLNVGTTLYHGTVAAHVVTFTHVNIIDGFQIRLF
jgi:hypothetical protein